MKYFYLLVTAFLLNLSISQSQINSGFTCQDAICLSENQLVSFNNTDAPLSSPEWFSCGISDNNMFFSFCPESGEVSIDIVASNCVHRNGLQGVIYTTDDCVNFEEVYCISVGSTEPIRFEFEGIPGQNYILMVDGFYQDFCDFWVGADGIVEIEYAPDMPELNVSELELNIGETFDLEVINGASQECSVLLWEVISGADNIVVEGSGASTSLIGMNEGPAKLCVIASNFCYSSEHCIEIMVNSGVDNRGEGFSCQEAICLSDVGGSITISNENVPSTPPESITCGAVHNNLFFSFTPEDSIVILDIIPESCNLGLGIQAVILETNDCENFIEHLCISNGSMDDFQIIFNGNPGQIYLLMIDGFVGDVCEFTVSASGIANTQTIPLDPELNIIDTGLVLCIGESFDIEIINDDDQGAVVYYWSYYSEHSIFGLQSTGVSATINGLSEGISELCVMASNLCGYVIETCRYIVVVPTPLGGELQDITTCNNYIDFCNLDNGFLTLLQDTGAYLDVSFHMSEEDARNNDNAIVCASSLMGNNETKFYARIVFDNCVVVDEFSVFYNGVQVSDIFLGPFCVGPIILNNELTDQHLNPLLFPVRNYYTSLDNAVRDRDVMSDPVIAGDADHVIWIATYTGSNCHLIVPITISVGAQEISADFDLEEVFGTFDVEVLVNGPAAPFEIIWADGIVGDSHNRLDYGRHVLKVLDGEGCVQELVFWILPSPFGQGPVIITESNEKEKEEFAAVLANNKSIINTKLVSIYPNPITQGGRLVISGSQSWNTIEIFDLDGKRLYQGEIKQDNIDLPNNINSGLYFINLSNENERKVEKLIIR